MNARNLKAQTSSERTEPHVSHASPQPVLEAVYGFAVTRALATAVELEIFTRVARGRATLEALCQDTGCSAGGLSMLLSVVTAMGFLETSADSYRLTAVSAEYLNRSSPRYIGDYVSVITASSWSAWTQLSDTIRTGRPARSLQGEQPDGAFFAELVPALHALTSDAATAAARALLATKPVGPWNVLDVAAGSAVWSLAIAREDREASLTVIDLPEVLDGVTRKFVEIEGYSDRFIFRPGNLRTMDLDEGVFDLIILGHVCHGEGAERSRSLIQRAHRALRPGGRILIAELLPDDDRRGPVLPLLFGLHMLVMTDEGGVFTLAEYRDWLSEAGFQDVNTLAVPAPSPLIMATKR